MTITSRRCDLSCAANRAGLYVRTYSPGDGVTRYRFFTSPNNSYFGPDNGIHTALGITAAEDLRARLHSCALEE